MSQAISSNHSLTECDKFSRPGDCFYWTTLRPLLGLGRGFHCWTGPWGVPTQHTTSPATQSYAWTVRDMTVKRKVGHLDRRLTRMMMMVIFFLCILLSFEDRRKRSRNRWPDVSSAASLYSLAAWHSWQLYINLDRLKVPAAEQREKRGSGIG